jgi:cytochrome c oxidase assembly factor CtaG
MAVLFVALVSPVDAISQSLFAVHMTQHMLLVAVAAPLLVLGRPGMALIWALPAGWRRPVAHLGARRSPLGLTWRLLTLAPVAWALQAAALWVWHVPGLYERAVASEPVHALEHATLLLTAVAFWWSALPRRGGARISRPAAIASVVAMALQGSVLGALLTLSNSPWFDAHLATTAAWGLTPLEDQQIAGLVMWIPAGLVYVAVAAVLFVLWMRSLEGANATSNEESVRTPVSNA